MIYLDQADGQFLVSLSKKFDDVTYVWPAWQSEEARRVHEPALRRTRGIVTDSPSSEPRKEADVIMTAAALGFAGDYIATTKRPLQFDMDPFDADDPKEKTRTALFHSTVAKMDAAVAAYLTRKGLAPSEVRSGLSPGYWPGATIMGVYALAGQETPQPEKPCAAGSPLVAPVLSAKGQELWDRIRTVAPTIRQYTGRGAYTGFVDNKNTEETRTRSVLVRRFAWSRRRRVWQRRGKPPGRAGCPPTATHSGSRESEKEPTPWSPGA